MGEISFSFFCASSNGKNEPLIWLSWHICVPFWTDVFLSVTGRDVRFTLQFGFTFVLCTQSPDSMSVCSRECLGEGWSGYYFSFPCSTPTQTPRLKCCWRVLPVGEAKLTSFLSLKPAWNPRSVACHQSPAPSSPQLNEQIRKEN